MASCYAGCGGDRAQLLSRAIHGQQYRWYRYAFLLFIPLPSFVYRYHVESEDWRHHKMVNLCHSVSFHLLHLFTSSNYLFISSFSSNSSASLSSLKPPSLDSLHSNTSQLFCLLSQLIILPNNQLQPHIMVAVQAPPAQNPLDKLDRRRLPELQYLSSFWPKSLNSKPCPHGSKCTLKRVCYVRFSFHFLSQRLTNCQVLCGFRSNLQPCDGHHDMAPMCDMFLTDKGCKYRKDEDHPWFPRSHDFELRRCMDVMIEPHRLGLYGVQHF